MKQQNLFLKTAIELFGKQTRYTMLIFLPSYFLEFQVHAAIAERLWSFSWNVDSHKGKDSFTGMETAGAEQFWGNCNQKLYLITSGTSTFKIP